ncbi:MAG TPA: response regulator transcription factor [Gammaproteobacteria bacterium]|nr:response regulator transcription factor [Gammaproteobacteria bacterium]
MTRLLIADDDIELCDLLRDYLQREGFTVNVAHDGQAALRSIAGSRPDLMILDVMLPQKSGFEVLRELRRRTDLPILMLTAKGDQVDRIVGLEMGADDYIPKPCDPRELVARIRAVLRRTGDPADGPSPGIVQVGDITLNTSTLELLKDGARVEATAAEFSVLHQLLIHAGKPVSKEELTLKCLGRHLTPHDRSIDVHVSNLRRKLGRTAQDQDRIKSIRGGGYQYIAIG